MTIPNQHPPVSSQLRQTEHEVQNKSSPGLAMEFGGKITLFDPSAWEKHWGHHVCPEPAWPRGCSHAHTWAERTRSCPHSHTAWTRFKKRELRVWEGDS